MKKYILTCIALMAICCGAMAKVANNALQLNFKDATDSLVIRLTSEPSYEFSADGTQMTVYKGTTAVGTAHNVSNIASLMYTFLAHQHTLTLVADTVFPTDETTGTLAYWQCTGTAEDPGCMLYFADALGTDTIGDATALAAWLAGEGFLPCVYENDKLYAVVNDTLIVRTDRISEMKNEKRGSVDTFVMTYTLQGAQKTYEATATSMKQVVFKKGEELKPKPITTGTAKRTGDIDVNWVQLWENGPKFAEYNIGAANNKAEDYGGYYCWGGSIDKDLNVAYNSGSDALTGDDDTATKLWGSNWRMLTQAELLALLDNCDVEWTTVSGVNGRKYTGKGDYSENSVFLPAAGYSYRDSVDDQGNSASYWSSTPDKNSTAFSLYFQSNKQSVTGDSRFNGYTVRAVLAE